MGNFVVILQVNTEKSFTFTNSTSAILLISLSVVLFLLNCLVTWGVLSRIQLSYLASSHFRPTSVRMKKPDLLISQLMEKRSFHSPHFHSTLVIEPMSETEENGGGGSQMDEK
jgi:hypothetical protein